jgi:queuosine precursor transporter
MKVKEQAVAVRQFKYLDIITALFVAVLLISNVVAAKITSLGMFTLSAAAILFPLSYIVGDVLTEVYGYARARKVVWIGMACNILMAAIFMAVIALPAAQGWPNQKAFETILGMTPRIVLASIIGYFAGEFLNSFVLAKVKLATKGKFLWARTISSTLVGELFDTLLFITIAFWGILPTPVLVSLLISNYIFKVGIEVVFTPVTYLVVNFLKKAEGEDYYDKKTNFNPFKIKS